MTAAALVALNLADAVLSSILFHSGTTTEANPLMAAAWAVGPRFFLAAKVVVGTACAAVLWRASEKPFVREAISMLSALYAVVVTLEIGMLILAR